MDILIVESAAKARTLQKYLGDGWRVVATGGHVETLPWDRKLHGKDATKAFWANRPGELPSPEWVWTERGEKAVQDILDVAGDDPTFWIATDPDREGEFIAWSLERRLAGHGPTHRVTFQEVTDEAVRRALEHPRRVDDRMVGSALVRKFLDRLVGFRTSKMAAAVVPGSRGASMGRVQTPTLGFVVDREMERERHVPIPYFETRATAQGVELKVRFHERDDADAWRDEAGQVDPSRTFDGALARKALAALEAAGGVTLAEVRTRSRKRNPQAPYTTDAILQDAGSRFGWSPRKTSALASILYEAGHITYIRTDSTRLADSAVQAARAVIREGFGEEYLGEGAARSAPEGPTQDAHEAIRPTRMEVEEVDVDDADARKLYRLVRARTLGSLMAPNESTTLSVEARCEGLERPLAGSTSWDTFAGWRAAYAEFDAPRRTAPPEIPLEEGASWPLDPGTEDAPNPLLVEDQTRPPPRFREHTLVKEMKDAGIGRPSTYARTVEKLLEREYVKLEEGALAPTPRGRTVWMEAAPLYAREASETHEAADLFDVQYTALMEERLDRIAGGEAPAPATWEEWRDQVRDLHEAAREQRNSGSMTFRQRETLGRLLANAPDHLVPEGGAAAELKWKEAQDLIGRLREEGVKPAPSAAQVKLIRQLVETLDMDEADAASLVDAPGLDALGTSERASSLIDELQRLRDEQLPPSPKQRRFIESLREQAGISEQEAAALVELESLEELTGGREGTASRLIDLLQERVEAKKAKEKGKQPEAIEA